MCARHEGLQPSQAPHRCVKVASIRDRETRDFLSSGEESKALTQRCVSAINFSVRIAQLRKHRLHSDHPDGLTVEREWHRLAAPIVSAAGVARRIA